MPHVTKAAEHFSIEEVRNRMQSDPRPLYRQRWLIIYNALVDPRTAEEIARHCGVKKVTVQQLISRYNRFGISAVETKGKGGSKLILVAVNNCWGLLGDEDLPPGIALVLSTTAAIENILRDKMEDQVLPRTVSDNR